MKNIECTIIAAAIAGGIVAAAVAPATALEGPGSAGASYLMLPVGPASIAMGEVGAALTGDPFNWLSNPALLHAAHGFGVGASHAEWILNTNYDCATMHRRINDIFVVSGAIVYQYRPDIQGYDDFGQKTKLLKNSNYQAAIGGAATFGPTFTVGATIKGFSETLDELSARGVAADIGILYCLPTPRINFGFSVQNLGTDVRFNTTNEPLRTTIRTGASYPVTIVPEVARLRLAVDAVKPRFERVYASGGAELTLYKMLAIRAGYCGEEYRVGNAFSLGSGVTLIDRLRVDYAWTPYGELGSFHRISVHFTIK